MVEACALSSPVPEISEAAIFAAGHVGGSTRKTFWRRALARSVVQHETRPGELTDRMLDELVYGLGVNHQTGLLREIAERHSVSRVRRAAQWWLNLPRNVTESAA